MNILIDAGACKGDFTASWLARNPEGKVYCIEPSKSNVEKLRLRFKDQNVEIIEKAVWLSEGEQTLWAGSSKENASITVCSEAQLENPEGESEQVECIKLSSLIRDIIDVKKDVFTLKIDIEGVEFRCLEEMFTENITPTFIYLEDGCRKCADTKEWSSRIAVFSYIIENSLEDRIFVEGNTKGNKDYLDCYVGLDEHTQFQTVKSKQGNLNPVIESLRGALLSYLDQNANIANTVKSIEFCFTWLTCHHLIVNLKSGESFSVRTIDPLNSTKDSDLVDRFINTVVFERLEDNQYAVSISFITFSQCQDYLDGIKKKIGKEGLL